MSIKQEATIMINKLPDDTVGIILELMKKMLSQKQYVVSEDIKPHIGLRLGIAEGKYIIPDNIDVCNDDIASMFGITK